MRVPIAAQLKSGPTFEPVSLADAKLHLRVDGDEEHLTIARIISAARSWVEEYTNRSLPPQTWQVSAPCWADPLWLPRAVPLQSVTFVKYYDASNVLQTLSSSVYTVPAFQEPASIRLAFGQVWPALYDRADAVRVEYVTGAATVGAIPHPLRQAVLLLIDHWFNNRGLQDTPTEAVIALCGPWRRWPQPSVAA